MEENKENLSADIQDFQDTSTDVQQENVEVIGIRFKDGGKIYYFDPNGHEYKEGTNAIVETARGLEYGYVAMENTIVPSETIVPPLRMALRTATSDDDVQNEENAQKEREAFTICAERIEAQKMEMKLVDAEYTFDRSKLLFYFSAESRVDFRELVRELASVFHCRIELRQIGIRDEARMIGGFGVCGRPFCCSTFLPDFAQVSIKMAKEQNLSLNSSKISGACGRLMCCLRFEHDVYDEAVRTMPKLGAVVSTPDGDATVIETRPLAGLVKVRMAEDGDIIKCFSVRELGSKQRKRERNTRPAADESKEGKESTRRTVRLSKKQFGKK